jgi:hypothetical protein
LALPVENHPSEKPPALSCHQGPHGME